MPQWSVAQQLAITYEQQQALLVSAAAGSGKTAVLSERILRRCQAQGLDLEKVAVITFTEKAAANMRQRLEKRLFELEAEAQSPEERSCWQSMQRQLPLARISTIHSFCLSIVRSYHSLLLAEDGAPELPAAFRILDPLQSQVLLDEAVEEYLTAIYACSFAERSNSAENSNSAEPSSFPERDTAAASSGNSSAEGRARSLPTEAREGVGASIYAQLERSLAAGEVADRAEYWESFRQLSLLLDKGKTDLALRLHFKRTLAFLHSLPSYDQWLQEAKQHWQQAAQDYATTPAAQHFLGQLRLANARAQLALADLLELPYTEVLEQAKTQEAQVYQANMPQIKTLLLEFGRQVAHSTATETWQLAYELGQKLPDLPNFRRPSSCKSPKDEAKQSFVDCYEQGLTPLLQLVSGNWSSSSQTFKRANLLAYPAVFQRSLPDLEADIGATLPLLSRYLEAVLTIDKLFQSKKRQQDGLDFSDFEHDAFKLLQNEEVAAALRAQYQEVYVDEYQDTNNLQEQILKALNPAKIFLVGDIKQSIYRFRHANPGLFATKLESYNLVAAGGAESGVELGASLAAGTEPGTEPRAEAELESLPLPQLQTEFDSLGEVILLNRNYRSRPALIELINSFFSSFLRQSTGELDYDEKQCLSAGLPESAFPSRSQEGPALSIKLLLREEGVEVIESETLEGGNDYAGQEELGGSADLSPEAVGVASNAGVDERYLPVVAEIRRLRCEGYAYEDIVVLARMHKQCEDCQQTLAAYDIPAVTAGNSSNVDNPEIIFLENFLALLVNFYQDVPLVAVLRSAVVKVRFSDAELAQIALLTDSGFNTVAEPLGDISKAELDSFQLLWQLDKQERSFHYRFLQAALRAKDERLRLKLQRFLRQYTHWRRQAEKEGLAVFLSKLLQNSSYLDELAHLPFARERLQTCSDFIEFLRDFTLQHGDNLALFRQTLSELRRSGSKVKGLNEAPQSRAQVRLMTLHASKGLEFPVVILAEASSRERSFKQDLLNFDAEEGISILSYDRATGTAFNNPQRLVFAERCAFKTKAESFRLLYVALTRAQERLIIMGSGRLTWLSSLVEWLEHNSSASELAQAESPLKLLLGWACTQHADFLACLQGQLESQAGSPAQVQRGELALELWELGALRQELEQGAGEGELAAALELTPAEAQALTQVQAQEQVQIQAQTRAEGQAVAAAEAALSQELDASELAAVLALLQAPLPQLERLSVPAKITVTELKEALLAQERIVNEEEGDLAEAALYPTEMVDMSLSLRTRRQTDTSAQQLELSGAEYGSLLHRALQHLSPQAYYEAEGSNCLPAEARYAVFQDQLHTWQDLRLIFPSEVESLRSAWPLLESWLCSSLAQELVQAERAGRAVWRELPFTLAVPAVGLEADSGEITLVQGMIDLFFYDSADEAVLVDFKSDRLQGTVAERALELQRRYATQIFYYAEAIKKIAHKEVKATWLWLLREGRGYELCDIFS